jgi:hypothetical protein
MDFDDIRLSDVVLFELPAGPEGTFVTALRTRWPGWQHVDGDVALVAAELQPAEQDLATLLRYAQDVLPRIGLREIRFYIDDRVYILSAGDRAAVA